MLMIRFNHTLQMWGVLRGIECLALFACLNDALNHYNAAILRN